MYIHEHKSDKQNKLTNIKGIQIPKELIYISTKIYNKIKEFISLKLYDKLFHIQGNKYDNQIYDQCNTLFWIDFIHLGINFKINIELFLPLFNDLMNGINESRT